MSNLQSNLSKLSESRAASKQRKQRTRASLAEFIETRIQRQDPTPVGGTPVAPAAVARRMASGSGTQHSMSDGHGHGSAAEVKGLNAQFNSALQRMIKDSGGRISITSGYRSVERQTQLWNAALKKYGSPEAARKWVAPPGKSSHSRGLAADIAGDKKWANANAAKYGLTFPLSNEDWHIEPINARKKR